MNRTPSHSPIPPYTETIEILRAELELERESRRRDKERYELMLASSRAQPTQATNPSPTQNSEITESAFVTSTLLNKEHQLRSAAQRIESLTRSLATAENDLRNANEMCERYQAEAAKFRPCIMMLEEELDVTHARLEEIVQGYERKLQEYREAEKQNMQLMSENTEYKHSVSKLRPYVDEVVRLQQETADLHMKVHRLTSQNAKNEARIRDLEARLQDATNKANAYEGVHRPEVQYVALKDRIHELERRIDSMTTEHTREVTRLNALEEESRRTAQFLLDGLPKGEIVRKMRLVLEQRLEEILDLRHRNSEQYRRLSSLESCTDVRSVTEMHKIVELQKQLLSEKELEIGQLSLLALNRVSTSPALELCNL